MADTNWFLTSESIYSTSISRLQELSLRTVRSRFQPRPEMKIRISALCNLTIRIGSDMTVTTPGLSYIFIIDAFGVDRVVTDF